MTDIVRTGTVNTNYATVKFTATAGLSVYQRHNLKLTNGKSWEFTAAEAAALIAAFPNNFAPDTVEDPVPLGEGGNT